ncbi:MAG: type II toxin-antitoxin system VapC family toxin [Actinomycetales bacterium]|nr:type II toxin-antitoxin system VapC family toxin [Actinomycetales bacterium]
MTLVVDASAVVTLVLDPSARGEAIARELAGGDLHAPDHLPVEVANVIRRLRHAGRLVESEALLALDGFWQLPVRLWPFEPLVERVWGLGANLTSYDAAYVALAEHIGGTLVTADERIARSPGIGCPVRVV